jgi:preprotein translocase subunit SecE
MARLQRKKPVSAKKKKQDSEQGSDAGVTEASVAVTTQPSTKPAAPVTKKKPPMPAKRGNAPAKNASPGKIKGIADQSIQFLREVKIELKKVAWPSKKQTMGSTAVVLILVFIIAAFLGVVDMGLSRLVRLVLQ